MGNFLFNSSLQIRDKHDKKQLARVNFISYIKKRIRLNQLPEIYEDFYKAYYPQFLLEKDQFDDVFSPLLNVTETFFEIVQERGRADFYMGMVGLVLFSQGEFEEKVSFLYQMFNTDGGSDMDRKEMGKFFLSSIQGLCKICNLPSPS